MKKLEKYNHVVKFSGLLVMTADLVISLSLVVFFLMLYAVGT